MKILILNGSPHLEKGSTGAVISALEMGMQSAAPEITKRNICSLDVKPCKGCFTCWSTTPGECTQKDDMREILALIREADILILATPVYVDGMTGSMKVALDRMLPLVKGRVELRDDHMRHIPRTRAQTKLALVSPSGFAELDNFDPLVAHVKAAAKNLNYEYSGAVLVPAAWLMPRLPDVLEKTVGLITKAGTELVEHGMIPPGVSEEIAAMVPREKVVEALNRGYGRFE